MADEAPTHAQPEKKRDFALVVAMAVFFALALAWLPLAFAVSVVRSLMRSFGEGTSMGENVYFVLVAFYVPALALFGFCHGVEWTRLRNALLLMGTSFVGLVVAGVIAVLLFPRYPHQGPHELVAAATALPAIALPMLAAKGVGRFRTASITTIGVLGCAVLGSAVHTYARPMEVFLPVTASVVHRWHDADWQDFSEYYVRADGVGQADAEAYAEAFGLTRTSNAFQCAPLERRERPRAAWVPSRRMQVWERDDRVPQTDRSRFPSGMSGCFFLAAWADDSLYACHVCSWGI